MGDQRITLNTVKSALMLRDFDVLNAHRLMAPQPRALRRSQQREGVPKLSAVLVLLFPQPDHELSFVMIQRPEYPGVHSGQIGLPGGRQEDGETYLQTALRETNEELGVKSNSIEVIGQLTDIYIPPSDFEVHPYVGYTPHKPVWQPDPTEVAGVIEMPLAALLDGSIKRNEEWEIRGFKIQVPHYVFEGHRIWGATAIMLSEMEGRLRAAVSEQT